MNAFRRLILLVFCLSGILLSLHAQKDSLRFSLLTCNPGTEIYSLFGHTAIRYQNCSKGVDLVFNYGTFSFNTPHFVYRFVKGETDYQLGIIPYKYFETEYFMRGSSVYEQELNLSQEEKKKLYNLLVQNYEPKNRIYRYNYFYDNCTTRARDKIEECINGRVVYEKVDNEKSFRKIIHEYTQHSLWSEFGIDFCLGAEADRMIDERHQMFSPFYMMDYADKAYIVDYNGHQRPLVIKTTKIVDAQLDEHPGFPISPMGMATLFLILNVLVAWVQHIKRKIYWVWDALVYCLHGISGCIIAFLFFFSVHPTVGSNWMILLFNPIPLIIYPYLIYIGIKQKKTKYYLFKMICLTLFIAIIPFCPQEINITILPLALGLLVNTVSHIKVYNKK